MNNTSLKWAAFSRLMTSALLTGLLSAGCPVPVPGPQGTVAAPQFSLSTGVYSDDQMIEITCDTGGAAIHYTTDGSTPTASSPVYATAVPVAGDGAFMLIQALAVKEGMNGSAVASAAYVINYGQVSTPQFSPAAGFYLSPQDVTITCATGGVEIRYTTDGTDPGPTSGEIYDSAVAVSANGMLKAIAWKSGMLASTIASALYAFTVPSAPVISGVAPGGRAATVTWDAVDGAASYNLYYAEGTAVTTQSGTRIANVASPHTVTGLEGGKTYAFIVTALNSYGESTAGAAQAAIPLKMWGPKGNVGFSAANAQFISLALGSNNAPYVAYQDFGNGYRATVMRFDGSNWVNVGNAGFSAGQANYISLALDSNNAPFVAYLDYGSGAKVTVMKSSGSGWVNVGNAGFSAANAQYISLALDSNNAPYVAYQDFGNANRATVMKWSGSSWVNVGSVGFSAGQANYISLALDSNNTPYVAYSDAGSSLKLTVMRFNGSGWVNVGSAGFSAGVAQSISLALDSNNTPYVAYQDFMNSYKATVMRFNGSSWETVGNAGFSAGGAYEPTLALDSNNIPHVAYRDNGYGNRATVMRWNGSSWETVGSAGFSAAEAQRTSLALDSNNTPYVAFMDLGNSYKATVMNYE